MPPPVIGGELASITGDDCPQRFARSGMRPSWRGHSHEIARHVCLDGSGIRLGQRLGGANAPIHFVDTQPASRAAGNKTNSVKRWKASGEDGAQKP